MSSKQDRTYTKTAADLERKFNFSKSFSEILGVANDAQTHAYNAEKAVGKLEKEVSELSILLKDEENGLLGKIEAKLDADKLVSQFNMAFNEITITSDHFELTAEGKIKAEEGTIAGWDISGKSIFKNNTRSLVQITAPESEDSDFISVALLTGNVIEKNPLRIKANGDIYTNGKIISANDDYTQRTEIDNGYIFSNRGEIGGWGIGASSLTSRLFTDGGVMHTVSLSSGLYNPNGNWDIDTALDASTVLFVSRSDGNGTKALFYLRPTGELHCASKNTDQYVKIKNGTIFRHGEPVVGKTSPKEMRILLMYFTGGNNEIVGLWATGYYDEYGIFRYTGLSVETP